MKLSLRVTVVLVSLGLAVVSLLPGCPASAPDASSSVDVPDTSSSASAPDSSSSPGESDTSSPSAPAQASSDASSAEAATPDKTPPSGPKPMDLTDANFDKVIVSGKAAAIIDFWAPWCSPCLVQGPIVETMATKYGDRIVIARVNVDEANRIATTLNIEAIPTLLFFRDGKEVKRIIGLSDEQALSDAIESTLLK